MLGNLAIGFQMVMSTPYNLLMILVGVSLGIFVGALPGLSSPAGLGILIPFTFFMEPIPAFLMMISLYMACQYGGSIASISLGIPGTPMSVATSWDGFPLAQRGLPGKALGTSLIASSIGGIIGTCILIVASTPISNFALRFGPAEYFALGLFGLSIVSNLTGKSVVKALISVTIGLLVCVIGIDIFSGYPRFTYGLPVLLERVPFIPILVGLFGVAKVFQLMEQQPSTIRKLTGKIAYHYPSLKELKGLTVSVLRGSGIGALIGAIPGAGATIASLVAYSEEKRASKHPEKFGTGILQGISAPESANNASVGGAMIPLLTLGIPGSASTAVLIGGLILQGLKPGPLLMSENPEFVYTLFVGFFFAVFFMFVMGLVGTRLWVAVTSIRVSILTPFILGLCIIGTYALGNSIFNVILALIFGILGYLMQKFDFPTAPLILAVVLGYMVESNFRRALAVSGGSYAIFFTHPISLILIIIAAASFALPFIRRKWAQTQRGRV